VGKVTTFL